MSFYCPLPVSSRNYKNSNRFRSLFQLDTHGKVTFIAQDESVSQRAQPVFTRKMTGWYFYFFFFTRVSNDCCFTHPLVALVSKVSLDKVSLVAVMMLVKEDVRWSSMKTKTVHVGRKSGSVGGKFIQETVVTVPCLCCVPNETSHCVRPCHMTMSCNACFGPQTQPNRDHFTSH